MSDQNTPQNPNEIPNPFERFTQDARVALQVSEQIAQREKASLTGTEHLLLALLDNPQSLAFSILFAQGISAENTLLSLPLLSPEHADSDFSTTLSGMLRSVVEKSVNIAISQQHNFVGGEHFLLAILEHPECNAALIFESMSLDVEGFRKEINNIMEQMNPYKQSQNKDGAQNILDDLFNGLSGAVGVLPRGFDFFEDDEPEYRKKKQKGRKNSDENEENDDEIDTESNTPALDFFSVDLTKMAAGNEIDPIIGRDKEIKRIMHILNRKTKNNPVLIGEPGVGKTAVIEGLALAIEKKEVPSGLLNKRVLSLDISAMVAGTKYRGEFEERLKEVIDDAIASKGEVIIFIDELHTIIGAGSGEGTLDAANILKPALSRGKVQVIGATTFDEYRKYIEKDKALERRFQSIQVDEPSEKDAIAIMNGIKNSFEKFHKIKIDESAVEASVRLSSRFIPDRFLPDKAIDLLDESCAGKGHRSQKQSKEVKQLEKKLKTTLKQKEKAVEKHEYDKAGKLKKDEEKLNKEIQRLQEVTPSQMSRVVISQSDIEATIARITNIPVERLGSDEMKKIKTLDTKLKKQVVGQTHAIEAVVKSIHRSRVGIASPNRPMGSFLFLGPTGVGKTELVRILAEEVYGRPEALIKIDMSEFMEKHSTSRLVGATAGYVGYEDGGELTEKVRRNPYSLILFDEIEKAHRDFQNILLQILEDGYLTDSKGRKIDFKNTLIVMTSNIGADVLTNSATKIGFSMPVSEAQKAEEDFEEKSALVLEQVKEHFRPEFLGRLDKTIVFKPLAKTSIKAIVKIHLLALTKRLKRQGMSISYSEAVVTYLAKQSFDSESGARKVRNVIQNEVEDMVTEYILEHGMQKKVNLKMRSKRGKVGGLELYEEK